MPSTTLPSSPLFTVRPLDPSLRKDTWLGAELLLNSPSATHIPHPSTFTPTDLALLRSSLFTHGLLVVRNQRGLDPTILPALAAIWDPHVKSTHSAGATQNHNPANILSVNHGARIPRAPQVQVIGAGAFAGHEGLPPLALHHVTEAEFHADPLSREEVDAGYTRFYRWHMDAPLYERLPGVVTQLLSVVVPREAPEQIVRFEDGEEMKIAAGATAFVSGARAFALLSPEEQEFALNTTVQYGPRPYEWMRDCKATSDGITIAAVGDERKLEDLAAFTWDKVQSHPMVWRNPGNPSQPHLQILGCCVYALHTADPATGTTTTISDLAEVRRICRSLQKKVVRPEHVYAHAWEEGDLVIFHNRGVWHSITGNLEGHRRLLWQCTMESSKAPEAWRREEITI